MTTDGGVARTRPEHGVRCSVVIPVRNDAPYLERCLRALRGQTRPPDEIVVVDNGSTDALPAVLARHPEVRCVAEPVRGVAAAAATGYDAARGDVILRCDSDSVPGPEWVERHVRVLIAAGAVLPAGSSEPHGVPRGREVVAASGIARFGPRHPRLGRVVGAAYITAYRLVAGTALGHWALWGSDMAFTRQWWQQVSAHAHRDAGVHDDFDLSFRVQPHQRVVMDPGSVAVVSWRAVVSPARIRRQLRMAATTLLTNWAEERPWQRWGRRLTARRAPGQGGPR
ncbi:glycosyltransferase family 2 protein [Streptomyces xinghaiensis]|uniref:glycosyltransferase family 2 protein n=1 Tax=Kocuria salsicia TaxID=664639 RepID=UPI0033D044E4